MSIPPRRDEHVAGHAQSASTEQRRAPQPYARDDDPAAADDGRLKGGELNAAITSALVGIYTEYLGRGPRSASTVHYGHVLVTLMHDVLTPAEKSLTRTDQTGAVDHIRHLFQETMESDFREAVERLTGRKVLAFISGNHIDPDIAAELFILEEPL